MEPVKVIYSMPEIAGTKITVFECGSPLVDDYGDFNPDELFKRTFATENTAKDVFYEAYVSGSNTPFFKSKTPPTDEELSFQLGKSREDGLMKTVIWIVVGLIILYLVFK